MNTIKNIWSSLPTGIKALLIFTLFIYITYSALSNAKKGTDKEAAKEAALHAAYVYNGETIGKWNDNSPVPRKIILFKNDNSVFMRSIYKDGSFQTDAILHKENKYMRNPEEWYVIEKNGKLGSYGAGGKYYEFEILN